MFARLSSRLAMRRSVSKRSECLRAARAWAERSQGTAEEQLHGDFGGAGGQRAWESDDTGELESVLSNPPQGATDGGQP